jgi:hypothetical protein
MTLNIAPTKIHWREAEAIVGRRLDRRVAYWLRDGKVYERALVVRSLAAFDSFGEKYPGGSAYPRVIVEDESRLDGLVNWETDLVCLQ